MFGVMNMVILIQFSVEMPSQMLCLVFESKNDVVKFTLV